MPEGLEKSKKIEEARKRYERIANKIRPFVRSQEKERPTSPGVWRRGADVPVEFQERFRTP